MLFCLVAAQSPTKGKVTEGGLTLRVDAKHASIGMGTVMVCGVYCLVPGVDLTEGTRPFDTVGTVASTWKVNPPSADFHVHNGDDRHGVLGELVAAGRA
jgi:hypothetical protein